MPEKAINRFDLQHEADRLLVTRYAPASAVVDEELKILHVYGHTGSYLQLAPGQANLNLLTMTHEALRPILLPLSKPDSRELPSSRRDHRHRHRDELRCHS